MFKGISPTTIIFALFRAIFVATSIGSLLLVAAVIITVSTSFISISSIEVKKLSAFLDLSGSGSIPVTSEPCALASLHTNCL